MALNIKVNKEEEFLKIIAIVLKEIKGKTKFANAVVKVDSELGEGQEFPDLQVNENGEFTFNRLTLVIDYTMAKS